MAPAAEMLTVLIVFYACLLVDETRSLNLPLPLASSRHGTRATKTSITTVWSVRDRRRTCAAATEQLTSKSTAPVVDDCAPSTFRERSRLLSRRKLLLTSTALASGTGSPKLSVADDGTSTPSPAAETDSVQPFAPSISNLLPATRVRLWIRQLVALTSQASGAEDVTVRRGLVLQLRDLLLQSPPAFISPEGGESAASRQYLAIPTLDSWNRARRQESDAASNFFGARTAPTEPFLPTAKNPIWALNEGVEQWGEMRQFQRLQREQRALEESNPIRAAFNAYTNNLLYGDSAKLTASPQVRRRLIRDDQVPDVSTVIRSDLDLRDLYRNQVLSAVDEARAELSYQLATARDDPASVDLADLSGLLITAWESCDLWFSLVPDQDAREALTLVLNVWETETGR